MKAIRWRTPIAERGGAGHPSMPAIGRSPGRSPRARPRGSRHVRSDEARFGRRGAWIDDPASSGRQEVGRCAYNQPPPMGGLEGGGRMRGRLLGIVSAASPVIVALAAVFTMAVPATGAVGPANINTSAAPGNEAEDAIA